MRYHTKGRRIIPLTHDSQTGATSHIIIMLRAAHKETTSPTLGQWHIFLLCLHLHIGDLFNRKDNRVITQEERGLNKIGPSLIPFQ